MLTIYSKDECNGCKFTKVYLERNAIPYVEHNIDHDPQAYNVAMGYGYQQAPICVVDFSHPTMAGVSWSGLNPIKLDQLRDER